MSEALSPDAPNEGAAVPETPAPEVAVEGASAGAETPPNVVSAERFNGLMSRYQSDKSEWESKTRAMEAELNILRNKEQETPAVPNEDVAELKAQVQELTGMLLSERQDAAKSKVLDEFPLAKPFADLIVGGTPEEMAQVAQTLHERMELLQSGGESTESPSTEAAPVVSTAGTEEAPPAAPAAPEHSGTAAATGQQALTDAVGEAIANRDFEAFLRAKSELVDAQTAQVA